MSSAVDWEQLDMISEGFSADFMEIYVEFEAEIPVLLNDLRVAVTEGDAERAARVAHQLKGAAANFGFVGVSGPMTTLEAAAKDGALDRAEEWIAAADAGYRAAQDEVRARRAG